MARTKRSNPGAGDAGAGRILSDLEQRETPRNSYRAARRDAPVNCPSCGREVQRRARQERFCSRRCRQKANYGEKVARGDFSTRTIARPTTATAARSSPLLSAYDGQRCIGFVCSRGKLGFEAFDSEKRSLGVYGTQREAAAAITRGPP